MKKTVTHPDGTTEVIEGSPEELVEYEDGLKKEGRKPREKKKEILKGAELEGTDWEKVIGDFFKKMNEQTQEPTIRWNWTYHQWWCPIVQAQNGWWGTAPPTCTCGASTITYPPTWSEWKIETNPGDNGIGTYTCRFSDVSDVSQELGFKTGEQLPVGNVPYTIGHGG